MKVNRKKVIKRIVKQLSFEQVRDELFRLIIVNEKSDIDKYYCKLLSKKYNKLLHKVFKDPQVN